jgi:hypothetical protein
LEADQFGNDIALEMIEHRGIPAEIRHTEQQNVDDFLDQIRSLKQFRASGVEVGHAQEPETGGDPPRERGLAIAGGIQSRAIKQITEESHVVCVETGVPAKGARN